MGSQTAVEGKQTFKRDLFIGLGQVSVCWNGSDLGTFQSDDAVAIGERVYQAFEEIVDLLDELYDIRGTSIDMLKDYRDKLLAENKKLEDTKRELLEAIRLTQEFAQLPCVDGWSWWDAYKKYRPLEADLLQQNSAGE